jgi:hypothetical protein
MVFKVPQFIEVEDKIVGPLTFKQAIYLVGGGAACFLLWTFLPKVIAIFIMLPVAALALALSFYKVNNRPFVILMESFLKFHTGTKLYLWHKAAPKKVATAARALGQGRISAGVPTVTGSRLHDLAWSLDVNETTQN